MHKGIVHRVVRPWWKFWVTPGFLPTCSCGWVGEVRPSLEAAGWCWRMHVRIYHA